MKHLVHILLGMCAGLTLSLYLNRDLEDERVEEPPAYLVVLGEVLDRPAFMQGYVSKLPPVYEQYGGEYLAVGGGPSIVVLEGQYTPPSYVISKWQSMKAARDFWNSAEYAPLKEARIANAWGDFDVLLIQGVPSNQ